MNNRPVNNRRAFVSPDSYEFGHDSNLFRPPLSDEFWLISLDCSSKGCTHYRPTIVYPPVTRANEQNAKPTTGLATWHHWSMLTCLLTPVHPTWRVIGGITTGTNLPNRRIVG